MSELVCLELSVLLLNIHVFAQAGTAQGALTTPYLLSSRDKPRAPVGVLYGRATRALANSLESFPAFAALDLAFIALHQSGGIWPTVWIVARIVYLPLYLFNVTYMRSLVWGVSIVAILGMLVRLAGWS